MMSDTYEHSQVMAALQASSRTWEFTYHILDRYNAWRFDAHVSSCSISNNDLADVKRTAKLNIRDTDADLINFATDRVQPVIKLQMPDGGWMEWNMGVFLMSAPTQQHTTMKGLDREVDAFDLGRVLRDDVVTDRYAIVAGTKYIDAIAVVINSANLPAPLIAGVDTVLANDKEWDPGTSKYVIINEMLGSINYASLSFDGNGTPVAAKYQSPSDAPSIYSYTIGAKGVVTIDGITESLDYGSVPNVFVRYVSNPDLATPLRSEYVNDNPSSPTSTVNVGRNIVDLQEAMDVPDQATLDSSVVSAAERASQVYSQVTFNSGMMPIHTTADVMYVDWGSGTIKYRETEWDLDLKAGGVMSHKVRRVVSV